MPRGALNNTAIVILGLVAAGRRNGYEISRTVARSTKFFWPASVSGIYPELRRLEVAGLLKAEDDPRGEVKRNTYELTPAGRAALRGWLLDDAEGLFEMRNEDLLRLFLASDLDADQQIEILRKVRDGHRAQVARFEKFARPADENAPALHRMLVLEYGIEMHRSMAIWCERAEQRLTSRRR